MFSFTLTSLNEDVQLAISTLALLPGLSDQYWDFISTVI